MSGAAGFFIELGLRLVVFTGVFWAAAVKDFITIDKKWARPLIARAPGHDFYEMASFDEAREQAFDAAE